MQHRIIISGGGTGGHIFPALSIAEAIRKIEPEADILFVGAEGKMEMERVPAAGYRIIFKPDVVVGVGGYASAPMLWKAASKGIPTLIQEQNSYAGLTNKILSRRARRICTAYPGMERFFPAQKIILTGNPIRDNMRPSTSTPPCPQS